MTKHGELVERLRSSKNEDCRYAAKVIENLEKEVAELEHVHQLDMSELTYRRRQVDCLMEGRL
jgi:hypothetical protein